MKDSTGFVISKDSLIQATQQGYGLEITHLEFLLRGFGGDCYRAETRPSTSLRTGSGISYFLKLHDPVNNQMMAASWRPFYLPLMHQLHAKGILPNIPHPLPTLDGALSLSVGANELVITNFIEGELVGFGELPESILAQLSEQVGILHNCSEQLKFEHPFIDKFEIVFEQDLINAFPTLATLDESASPGQILLRDSILPHQDEIITSLQRLKELRSYAANAGKPMVICHTDLHGGNLMTDQEGQLYILDWENAMMAPPEHDMIFFTGENNFAEIFWPNYIRQFSSASIDCEILRFYFYRRGLEDIADFILRILRGNNSPERDQQEIEWMMDCLAGMEQIETTISRLKQLFNSS